MEEGYEPLYGLPEKKGGLTMKFVPMIMIIFSMLFVSSAIADTMTVYNEPAGIYDAMHAKLAVEQQTGRAYIRVFLMDEGSYGQCYGNQAAMQGISSDNCRVKTLRVTVPGLLYNAAQKEFTLNGDVVRKDELKTDLHYTQIDDGTKFNSVKYARVTLEMP